MIVHPDSFKAISTVYSWDAETFTDPGATEVGEGGFPPDAHSLGAGTEGVWVTLASQKAVGFNELGMADFGWSVVTRSAPGAAG